MKKPNLPGKTVERLSQYRRILLNCINEGKKNIYSHELAKMMNSTPVQVRRDFMLIGYSGSQSKGYEIRDLITLIGKIIDSPRGQKVAIIGMGNLGRAITAYFIGKRDKLTIAAAFDVDTEKAGRVISGVPCYHISKLAEVINHENISIAVLTVAPEATVITAQMLCDAGIKGILNYTSVPLTVPDNVYLEEYDIITSLEKVAFFVKK